MAPSPIDIKAQKGKLVEEEGGTYSFVACLSRSTIDHASLYRLTTVPTPARVASKIQVLSNFRPYITQKLLDVSSSMYSAVCGHHVSPSLAIASRGCLMHQTFPATFVHEIVRCSRQWQEDDGYIPPGDGTRGGGDVLILSSRQFGGARGKGGGDVWRGREAGAFMFCMPSPLDHGLRSSDSSIIEA